MTSALKLSIPPTVLIRSENQNEGSREPTKKKKISGRGSTDRGLGKKRGIARRLSASPKENTLVEADQNYCKGTEEGGNGNVERKTDAAQLKKIVKKKNKSTPQAHRRGSIRQKRPALHTLKRKEGSDFPGETHDTAKCPQRKNSVLVAGQGIKEKKRKGENQPAPKIKRDHYHKNSAFHLLIQKKNAKIE